MQYNTTKSDSKRVNDPISLMFAVCQKALLFKGMNKDTYKLRRDFAAHLFPVKILCFILRE